LGGRGLEGGALEGGAQPAADEGLPRVFDPHARAVDIGEAKRAAAHAVDVVEEKMKGLACRLVDAVDVDRADAVLLVDGQVFGPPVNLTGRGEDDRDLRIDGAADLEQGRLGPGADVRI